MSLPAAPWPLLCQAARSRRQSRPGAPTAPACSNAESVGRSRTLSGGRSILWAYLSVISPSEVAHLTRWVLALDEQQLRGVLLLFSKR